MFVGVTRPLRGMGQHALVNTVRYLLLMWVQQASSAPPCRRHTNGPPVYWTIDRAGTELLQTIRGSLYLS